MSIASEITRLNNAKAAIKQSLANKGVEVSDSALLDEYPALIDSIEVGSGEGGNPAYEAYWNLKTNNNTKYNGLFSGYTGTELDVSELDTSNVTTMCDMFNGCTNLTTLDVSNFNTNKVNDMQNMFYECNKLSSLDVSGWVTNNVTNMVDMFYNCSQLTQLNVSNWDTSNVTTMGGIFYNCTNLNSLDVSNWDTSDVTDMGGTFRNCRQLSSLSLSNFSTGNVTDMYAMFADCSSLYELDIRNFDMTNVSSTDDMFANCYNLTTLHLDECDIDTISKIIESSGFPADNYGTIYCKEENVTDFLTPPGNWTFELISSGCPFCGNPDCEYPTSGQNARCPECRKPYRTSNPNCGTHMLHGF